MIKRTQRKQKELRECVQPVFVFPAHHPLHCEQLLQHSNTGSSRPDEWILMRVRFPGSQTGHICLRFHLAIDDQEDARAGSGQITRVRASPRTSHRFGHLRSSSDISGHLGDRFHPQKYNWGEVQRHEATIYNCQRH